MIDCRTGKWYHVSTENTNTESTNTADNINQKYYSPLFRIKKTNQTTKTRYSTSFLNFTVWWECINDYIKKTYTVNTCMYDGIYNYIFRDETPDNKKFEVVAVVDAEEDGYTTYYVNSPGSSVYDKKVAQLTINKCDLLPSIEFLGHEPFDFDLDSITESSDKTIIRHDKYNYLIGLTEVDGSGFTINKDDNNIHIIKNEMIYVRYTVYTGTEYNNTNILRLYGLAPNKEIKLYPTYIVKDNSGNITDSGVCKVIIGTDRYLNISGAKDNMEMNIEFTYPISNFNLPTA